MTLEEYNNLEHGQEVFYIKKVRIKEKSTFTSGVDRFAVRDQQVINEDSYHSKKGDTYFRIMGAKGNKNANRALHLYSLDQWYIDRDEALVAKIKIMKRAIKNCNAPSVKSMPQYLFKHIMQQNKVIKLAGSYPELFI